jgi:hypothetical protein
MGLGIQNNNNTRWYTSTHVCEWAVCAVCVFDIHFYTHVKPFSQALYMCVCVCMFEEVTHFSHDWNILLTKRNRSCFSIRLISGTENITAYRAQCLFLGDVSFRYFEVTINVAKKIRWHVHAKPFATATNFRCKRAVYTNEANKVPVWTPDRFTT